MWQVHDAHEGRGSKGSLRYAYACTGGSPVGDRHSKYPLVCNGGRGRLTERLKSINGGDGEVRRQGNMTD